MKEEGRRTRIKRENKKTVNPKAGAVGVNVTAIFENIHKGAGVSTPAVYNDIGKLTHDNKKANKPPLKIPGPNIGIVMVKKIWLLEAPKSLAANSSFGSKLKALIEIISVTIGTNHTI